MLGHGARHRGILPTESIPWDGLRDVRRQLECARRAKTLSARLLAKSDALDALMIRLSVFLAKWPFGWTPDQARGDAYATELKQLRNRLRIFAGGIATFVECRCRTVKHCRS
jgi:hypothetical protein